MFFPDQRKKCLKSAPPGRGPIERVARENSIPVWPHAAADFFGSPPLPRQAGAIRRRPPSAVLSDRDPGRLA
jgi:hypothetical protein